jgi:elongation factor G
MGELHLDVYVERMRREYKADVETGMPQVAYREAINSEAEFDYTHKKQTGGAGQFGRVVGRIQPIEDSEENYDFVNKIKGGNIPTDYIPACDHGFKTACEKGSLIGFPIIGIRVILEDGQYHPVDSSEMAFQMASIGAFRQAYKKANPKILEPIMRVGVETPTECQGAVFGSISQRRGTIISSVEDGMFTRVEAEVPLSEMFGYSTVLRSLTQGKAEFTMEFEKYSTVPKSIAEEMIEEYRTKQRQGQAR